MSDSDGNATILLVEDHNDLAASIGDYLEAAGFAMDFAADGAIALNLMEENPYDAIILDLMLPKIDGIRVCEKLRERGDGTPILMLTARDQLEDKVTGFNAGADDYLVKPFSFAELLARLAAIARRSLQNSSQHLTVGPLTLEPATRRVIEKSN
jgi:DNA-binding response OmpR family regulator